MCDMREKEETMGQIMRTTPSILSSSSISGDAVVNRMGDSLGKIEDLMIDLSEGQVAYAVLSFGGFLGMGNKLFAIPFDALELDAVNRRFILDIPKERLEAAPGFDKDNWPDFADRRWGTSVYEHYGRTPYWH
jgi:sporulation protein YlmC with PRC-barrel domain